MPADSHRQQRRSTRLRGYDYTQAGAYFVTICTHQRQCLFGQVHAGDIHLNECGDIATKAWLGIPDHAAGTRLDAWIVMPNHMHGIVVLPGTSTNNVAAPRDDGNAGDGHDDADFGANAVSMPMATPSPPSRGLGINVAPGSLGAIIRSYKSAVTRTINLQRDTLGAVVWQRGYWERIVRDEEELNAIRRYIADNPRRWEEDRENLERLLQRMTMIST